MTVSIFPSSVLGPVKPVNGVGQPPIIGLREYPMFRYLREAGIPFSRLHDVGGMFGRGVFVDIPNLFRDFDADENDPASYDFAFTDILVNALVAEGIEPFFRLGTTIENYTLVRRYRIDPPKDFAKWARICEHVIRHYTEGWAGGFRHGISHWEIWNEPENWETAEKNECWHGTFEEYCRLYDVASKHLKAAFPHLKIGGFASCGVGAAFEREEWHPDARMRNQLACFHFFLKYVKEHGCPIDFFSYHSYAPVGDILLQARYVREHLDKAGFAGLETCLNEWLPAPNHDKLGTARQASEIAATLICFQNGPVDSAAIYDARCGIGNYSPLFNPLTYKPHKAYWAFVAFGELRKRGTAVEVRVVPGGGPDSASPLAVGQRGGGLQTAVFPGGGRDSASPPYAAAAADSAGNLAVMVANCGDAPVPFSLEVAGNPSASRVLPGAASRVLQGAASAAPITRCRIVDDARTWEEIPLPAVLPPFSLALLS